MIPDMSLVYHFSGARRPARTDSTGNANNAQNAGTSADGSMIGGGLRFDGRGIVTIPAYAISHVDKRRNTYMVGLDQARRLETECNHL